MAVEVDLKHLRTKDRWARALQFIPNGTQTYSKCPDRYVNGVYPKFLVRGEGCIVEDDHGRCFTDYIAGLGPIILGYNNRFVNNAVKTTIQEGQVLLSLPHPKEITLAETLFNNIPCAKKSKFVKTGSEALSAAVRIARAYTGKEKVVVCGYHGWHDWYAIVNDKKAGIPKALADCIVRFKYNDLESLKDCFILDDVAAVIMEPVVYEEPKDNFLAKVKELAHEHNALFIFDEVVTGFRFGVSGAQGYFDVVPDIACFSKAMGNGFPIAAVCGYGEFMDVFERNDFFVSGTFGGDLVGITAALAVIDALKWHEGDSVKRIWKNGERLKTGFNDLCKLLELEKIRCSGYAPRTFFDFPSTEHKALFWQECLKNSVLFGYANFIMTAHTSLVIENTLNICEGALRVVKDNYNDPKARLEGDVPVEVFRLR